MANGNHPSLLLVIDFHVIDQWHAVEQSEQCHVPTRFKIILWYDGMHQDWQYTNIYAVVEKLSKYQISLTMPDHRKE